ncbi:hypothetical protein Tco_1115009 [Tanacetum coccineum]
MFGNNSGNNPGNNTGNNFGNNNRVENVFKDDNANNNGTNNATAHVVGEEDLPQLLDSKGDVEEDTRSSNEFLADLNAELHDKALLTHKNRFM